MSETLVERIKRWNETKPNDIIQAFSSDLHEIVQRAEQAKAERDEYKFQRDEWRKAYDIASETREKAEADAQKARYEATMEAARKVYDIAIVYKDAGDTQEYSALMQAFNKIVTSKAANP